MKVTIVTLYDSEQADNFVGVVSGSLSKEQRQDLATAYDAVFEIPDEDGEYRQITFAMVDMVDSPSLLRVLRNVDGDVGGVVDLLV